MFSIWSSSLHTINSDRPMKWFHKIGYLALNTLSNSTTKLNLGVVGVKKFQPSSQLIQDHFGDLNSLSSPSRIINNIFWEDLDWTLIRSQLGGQLRVIEVGCGTGRYGVKLRNIAQIDSYRGVDIEASSAWNEINLENFEFETDSYENFSTFTSGENLIITQSALEHFEKDVQFFDSIRQYAESIDYPLVSIHLFPSPACLFTMLLHGIRQYNRRTIAKLIRASGITSSTDLYILGGVRSNFFHFRELTLRSLVFRKPMGFKNLNRYLTIAQEAIIRDSLSPSKFSPSFYALVLSWNTKRSGKEWIKSSRASR